MASSENHSQGGASPEVPSCGQLDGTFAQAPSSEHIDGTPLGATSDPGQTDGTQSGVPSLSELLRANSSRARRRVPAALAGNSPEDTDVYYGLTQDEPTLTYAQQRTLERYTNLPNRPIPRAIVLGWRTSKQWLEDIYDWTIHTWQASSQARTMVRITVATTFVLVMMGGIYQGWLTDRVVNATIQSATASIDQARRIAEEQINSWDTTSSVEVRLNAARAVLADRASTTQISQSQSEYTAPSNADPVLMATNPSTETTVTSPTDARSIVPDSLRAFIAKGQVAYQFVTLTRSDHTSYKALIVGTPVSSEIPSTELYLILPMDQEENTLAMTAGLTATTGAILLVATIVITWAFTQQLMVPLRRLTRTAERFAAGHLTERLPEGGSDEIARLSESFNQMATSIQDHIQALKESGQMQQKFTSDVSHELRTPLTSVVIAGELLNNDPAIVSPASRRATGILSKELGRFDTLLTDLLQISRHDAGVEEITVEEVDIRGCVIVAYRQTDEIAQQAGISIRVHMPSEPVPVICDSRRVERVVRNLLANAVDHAEGNPVDVALRATDRAVSIAVLDHGVGLGDEAAAHVFDRFWRADPSRVRHAGGTGLGLAIAYSDADLHGGYLDVKGLEGVGTMFRLTLAIDPEKPVTLSEAPLPLCFGDDADSLMTELDALFGPLPEAILRVPSQPEPAAAPTVQLEEIVEQRAQAAAERAAAEDDLVVAHIKGDALPLQVDPGKVLWPTESLREVIPDDVPVADAVERLTVSSSDELFLDDEEISEEELRAAAEFDDFAPDDTGVSTIIVAEDLPDYRSKHEPAEAPEEDA